MKILRINSIKKYFGGVKALDGCTFAIDKGKITALIGPNGSGKSTIFNTISHLIKKDSGKIYFEEHDLTKEKNFQIARRGISRTFQEVRLFRNLTIQEHLEIALNRRDEWLLYSFFTKNPDHIQRIKEVLEIVGLDKSLNTYATDLSYGQRKLLDLAIAIAKPHQLLMLDEPVAGVNPKLRQEIKKILRKLNKQGETILLIEHDMNFVMDLAEHIFVMDNGRVIAEGKPKEIQDNPRVLNAYLGE